MGPWVRCLLAPGRFDLVKKISIRDSKNEFFMFRDGSSFLTSMFIASNIKLLVGALERSIRSTCRLLNPHLICLVFKRTNLARKARGLPCLLHSYW